eukprot:GHVS01037553.1.p1 GENE.GHVS01037553.1~~GHVS01037553.1.p1  ORF type:complete len:796 (-),score=177.69 GHVS01037553.1:890-3277(-)
MELSNMSPAAADDDTVVTTTTTVGDLSAILDRNGKQPSLPPLSRPSCLSTSPSLPPSVPPPSLPPSVPSLPPSLPPSLSCPPPACSVSDFISICSYDDCVSLPPTLILPTAVTYRRFCGLNRWSLIVMFMTVTALTGNIYWGWGGGFREMFFRHGAYAWLCEGHSTATTTPPGLYPTDGLCVEQETAVGDLLTIGYMAHFSLSVFAGIMLDYLGPRWTAIIGYTAKVLGFVLLAISGRHLQAYIPGMILLAGSHDFAFLPILTVSALFTDYAAIAISLLGACKALSGSVPVALYNIWNATLDTTAADSINFFSLMLIYGVAIVLPCGIVVALMVPYKLNFNNSDVGKETIQNEQAEDYSTKYENGHAGETTTSEQFTAASSYHVTTTTKMPQRRQLQSATDQRMAVTTDAVVSDGNFGTARRRSAYVCVDGVGSNESATDKADGAVVTSGRVEPLKSAGAIGHKPTTTKQEQKTYFDDRNKITEGEKLTTTTTVSAVVEGNQKQNKNKDDIFNRRMSDITRICKGEEPTTTTTGKQTTISHGGNSNMVNKDIDFMATAADVGRQDGHEAADLDVVAVGGVGAIGGNVKFFDTITSFSYLLIIPFFSIALLRHSFFNVSAKEQFPAAYHVWGVLSCFRFILCVLMGVASNLLGLFPALFAVNTLGTIMCLCGALDSAVADWFGIFATIGYTGYCLTQLYTYINQTQPACHFGKLTGIASVVAGLFQLSAKPMYSVSKTHFEEDFLPMDMLLLGLSAVNYVIILFLLWRKRKQRKGNKTGPVEREVSSFMSMVLVGS